MNTKAKILFVGPTECGKSTICNYLSDFSEIIGGDYIPTVGCRILEIEQDFKVNNRNIKGEIELWDCSGDLKYQNCWNALADEANGIVFVYNPGNPNHESDINIWYSNFIENGSVRDNQCLLIAHQNPNLKRNANLFNEVQKVNSNLEEEGEQFREEFKKYLNKILAIVINKKEQEEQRILKN